MANMAYFNGTNAKLDILYYGISQGNWKNTFDVYGGGYPVSGSFYPVGEPVRINSSGQVYVAGGSYSDVVGSTDILANGPHHVEVTIVGTTASIYIDGNLTAEASGTVDTNPASISDIGHLESTQEYWFKGFISNYRIYDNTTNLVFSLPMTSNFIADVGGDAAKSEHVSIFDTADLPYASRISVSENTKNFGYYFNIGTFYHYWCTENETNIGQSLHVGHGPLYDRSGGVLNFALPTAIPRNSRITEARLVFTGMADTDTNTTIIPAAGARSRITGWKTASPSSFADWTAYKAIRGTVTGGASDSNLTDNQVTMDIVSENCGAGYVYSSPSLVNIVQEIVNLGNISNIALFWDDHENRSAEGYGFIADYYLYLIVKYDAGSFTCSLTYDANEGTGTVPTNTNTYEPGDSVTVASGNGLTNPGHDFAGWATHKDGTGTVIQSGDTFTIQANTVLYAKWAAQLTVTYNANGAESGTVPVDSATYHPGDTIIVPENTGELTRTGYTFRSWNTAADGTGVTYLAGSQLTFTESITLYANWDLAIYSSEEFLVVNLPSLNEWRHIPVPEALINPAVGDGNYIKRTGFALRFVLPYVIPRGTIIKSASLKGVGGVALGITETAVSGEGTSCFIRAHLSPAPAAITGLTDYMSRRGLNGSAGQITAASANFSDREITPGAAFEPVSLVSVLQELASTGDVSSIVLFIDDHNDWSDDDHAYSLALPMGLSYSYDCTVAYNGNGSTGGTLPVDGGSPYSYGDTVTILGNTGSLTRNGYTFLKWNTKADGTGTDYHAGDRFIISANTTLYAQWVSSVSSNIFYVGYNGSESEWMEILIPEMTPNPGVGNVQAGDMTKIGYAVRFVLPSPIPMGAAITSVILAGTGGASLDDVISGLQLSSGIGTRCMIYAQANVAPTAITTLAEYVSRRGLVADGSIGDITELLTTGVDFSNREDIIEGEPFTSGSLVSILQELVNMGDVSSVLLFVDDHSGLSADNHVYSIALQQTLSYEYACKVTYDGNGNTGGTAPVDVHTPYTSFDPVTVLGNTGSLTKHGYTFSKWNTAADGSGTDYDPDDTFAIRANTILYAQWKIAISKVVTIVAWDTVNECGRTGEAANITVRGVRDGVEYAPVDATVTEVDAVNLPGIYTVSLTRTENDCYFNTVGGKSSTTGVVIKPTFWRNEEEKESCCIPCCKKC
jgi:uncharacterized repeat protein (TIGR02543 family)